MVLFAGTCQRPNLHVMQSKLDLAAVNTLHLLGGTDVYMQLFCVNIFWHSPPEVHSY